MINLTSGSAGSVSGRITHVNQTPLAGAAVSLFYQNGTSSGRSTSSGADGRFQFDNVAAGSYYANATMDGFVHKPFL